MFVYFKFFYNEIKVLYFCKTAEIFSLQLITVTVIKITNYNPILRGVLLEISLGVACPGV